MAEEALLSGSWDGTVEDPVTEAQEADPVTFEDVASEEDITSEYALDAVSDDANQNDLVDPTTTTTTDDGTTYTNTGSGGSPEWTELAEAGVETDPTEGPSGSEVDGTTAGESVDNSQSSGPADAAEDALNQAANALPFDIDGKTLLVALVVGGAVLAGGE